MTSTVFSGVHFKNANAILSEEDSRALITLLSKHEQWMREYKALFERRWGEVDDPSFAGMMADPADWDFPDGRTVEIFDRTDEDIDTDSVRTYDVFFDGKSFCVEHVPLSDEMTLLPDRAPHERPFWLHSLAQEARQPVEE